MKYKGIIQNKVLINICFFITLFILAICYTIISPVLIELSRDTGHNIESVGIIFSFYFGGFLAGSFLSSFLMNYFRRKNLFTIFYIVFFSAICSMFFASSFIYVAIVYMAIGLAGGFLESQISSMLIEINSKNAGLFMNLSQVFFGIGAFAGPYIVISIIGAQLNWRIAFALTAALSLFNLIFFLFLDISGFENIKVKSSANIFRVEGLNNKTIFMLLLFSMFFYTGAEIGLSGWIPTYLRLNRHFNEASAGKVLSYFWIATIAGRISIGFISRKINIRKILIIASFFSIVFTISGIFLKNPVGIIISYVLCGFSISSIWPLLVTESGLAYPEKRNLVVSMMTFMGGLGGLTAPLILTGIYSKSGLFMAMNLNYIFLLVLLVFMIVLFLLREKESPSTKILDKKDIFNLL